MYAEHPHATHATHEPDKEEATSHTPKPHSEQGRRCQARNTHAPQARPWSAHQTEQGTCTGRSWGGRKGKHVPCVRKKSWFIKNYHKMSGASVVPLRQHPCSRDDALAARSVGSQGREAWPRVSCLKPCCWRAGEAGGVPLFCTLWWTQLVVPPTPLHPEMDAPASRGATHSAAGAAHSPHPGAKRDTDGPALPSPASSLDLLRAARERKRRHDTLARASPRPTARQPPLRVAVGDAGGSATHHPHTSTTPRAYAGMSSPAAGAAATGASMGTGGTAGTPTAFRSGVRHTVLSPPRTPGTPLPATAAAVRMIVTEASAGPVRVEEVVDDASSLSSDVDVLSMGTPRSPLVSTPPTRHAPRDAGGQSSAAKSGGNSALHFGNEPVLPPKRVPVVTAGTTAAAAAAPTPIPATVAAVTEGAARAVDAAGTERRSQDSEEEEEEEDDTGVMSPRRMATMMPACCRLIGLLEVMSREETEGATSDGADATGVAGAVTAATGQEESPDAEAARARGASGADEEATKADGRGEDDSVPPAADTIAFASGIVRRAEAAAKRAVSQQQHPAFVGYRQVVTWINGQRPLVRAFRRMAREFCGTSPKKAKGHLGGHGACAPLNSHATADRAQTASGAMGGDLEQRAERFGCLLQTACKAVLDEAARVSGATPVPSLPAVVRDSLVSGCATDGLKAAVERLLMRRLGPWCWAACATRCRYITCSCCCRRWRCRLWRWACLFVGGRCTLLDWCIFFFFFSMLNSRPSVCACACACVGCVCVGCVGMRCVLPHTSHNTEHLKGTCLMRVPCWPTLLTPLRCCIYRIAPSHPALRPCGLPPRSNCERCGTAARRATGWCAFPTLCACSVRCWRRPRPPLWVMAPPVSLAAAAVLVTATMCRVLQRMAATQTSAAVVVVVVVVVLMVVVVVRHMVFLV